MKRACRAWLGRLLGLWLGRLLGLWLGMWLGMLPGMGLAAQGGQPRLTVRVLNPAGIPPKTLLHAEQVAAAIFDQAGVEITWRPCPPCGVDLAPNEYWLHLLTSRPPHLHGDAMGYAVLMPERDGAVSYGGVFWQAVEQAAASLNAGEAALLGATMAHELGHILLRSSGHAWTGVMCRRFQKTEAHMAATGGLRFTLEQAARIQAGLTGARRLHQPPTPAEEAATPVGPFQTQPKP